jgi:hypothetical protein
MPRNLYTVPFLPPCVAADGRDTQLTRLAMETMSIIASSCQSQVYIRCLEPAVKTRSKDGRRLPRSKHPHTWRRTSTDLVRRNKFYTTSIAGSKSPFDGNPYMSASKDAFRDRNPASAQQRPALPPPCFEASSIFSVPPPCAKENGNYRSITSENFWLPCQVLVKILCSL